LQSVFGAGMGIKLRIFRFSVFCNYVQLQSSL